MSGTISIDVCTLEGVTQNYCVDLGSSIRDFIINVIESHGAYVGQPQLNRQTIDLDQTKLIHNSRA